jgi:hypothetical protein
MITCKNCVVGLFGMCHNMEFCRLEREILMEQAQQSAEQRGHTLAEFVKVKGCAIWQAQCIRCDWLAAINLDPPPNEADIYGEAVTTACPEIDGEQSGATFNGEVS